MAMNAIEQLLSDTADQFESGLTDVAKVEAEALLDQGNKPGVTRELNAMPGYAVTIIVTTSLAAEQGSNLPGGRASR